MTKRSARESERIYVPGRVKPPGTTLRNPLRRCDCVFLGVVRNFELAPCPGSGTKKHSAINGHRFGALQRGATLLKGNTKSLPGARGLQGPAVSQKAIGVSYLPLRSLQDPPHSHDPFRAASQGLPSFKVPSTTKKHKMKGRLCC